jgi:hypothetical protein
MISLAQQRARKASMFSTLTMDEYVVIAAVSAFTMVLGALVEMRRSHRMDKDDRRRERRAEEDVSALSERVRYLEIEFARESGRREGEGGSND